MNVKKNQKKLANHVSTKCADLMRDKPDSLNREKFNLRLQTMLNKLASLRMNFNYLGADL